MKRIVALIIVCALAAALSGCLFDTRDADPPDTGGGGCAATPLDDPLGVFAAMTCALESKTDAAYERAISQRFVFSPTEQDSTNQAFQGTTVFVDWTKDVEMQVLRKILSDAQSIDVTFNPSILINQTTFVRYRVPYELKIVNVTAPADTAFYAGVAQFDVRNEGGNWRLTFWDEIEVVGNQTTWGFLRGITRKQLNP